MGLLKQIRDRRTMRKAVQILSELEKDTSASYGKLDYYYIEDVMTNEFGEKMFIFSHKYIKPKGLKADGTITKTSVTMQTQQP